jgi:diadenosine tetraphosphatase ApaH/serine/threonine PP2A family protein phosphatase
VRTAIISDLHANLPATEAVLERIERADVQRIVCLGDIVGYGADPNPVCSLVRKHADLTIVGNHDAAVSGRMDYSNYYEAARHALDWTLATLDVEHRDWLESLPYQAESDGLCFVHGSPIFPEAFDYVFNLELARAHCRYSDRLSFVTFMGHTHLTRSWRINEAGAWNMPLAPFRASERFKYLVTVGSVGQPRDYDPRACFVIFDSETQRIEHIRVPYDINLAGERIRAAGLSDHFARRLARGV